MSDNKVKVSFPIDTERYGFSDETPWCELLGDGKFKLLNIPFFATGVSLHDVFEVESITDHGDARVIGKFLRVVEKSGWRTLRVQFEDKLVWSLPLGTELRAKLKELGCELAGGFHGRLLCIAVPAEDPQSTAPDLMQSAVKLLRDADVVWECSDPPKALRLDA